MLAACHFIFGKLFNVKVFTVTVNVTVTLVRAIFPKMRNLRKNFFFKWKFKKYLEFFSSYSIRSLNINNDFWLIWLIFLYFLQKLFKKIPVGQKNIAKLLGFHSRISLNDFEFWHFSIPPRHVRVYEKIQNPNIFALFGLWKPSNPKIPQT